MTVRRRQTIAVACMTLGGLVFVFGPVTGAIATVLGLRSAFDAVSAPGVPPAEKSALLAGGISSAMNATVWGLVSSGIAFPFLVIGIWLLVRNYRATSGA